MKSLVLENISMIYDDKINIENTFNLKIDSLEIKQGEFFTLIGESGCGKTTALRIIAGLEKSLSGSIRLDGIDISGVSPEKRGIGMVFQKPLLFPHMSVYENLEFALKARKTDRKKIAEDIKIILKEIDLTAYENKYPRELSGGESQRISLARALLLDPKILLMDEPFSALDVNTRLEMQKLIKKLHVDRKMTIIFVTHDLEEAFSLSSRLAIMNKGSIFQVDSPYNLYTHPGNEFVAKFVGASNVYNVEDFKNLIGEEEFSSLKEKYSIESKKIAFRAKSVSIKEDSKPRDYRLVYSKFKGDICSLHFEKNGLRIIADVSSYNSQKFNNGDFFNLSFNYSEMINIKE